MLAGDSPLGSTLHMCLPHLRLIDVVRFGTCSQSMARACHQQLVLGNSMLAHQLLQAAVDEAAAPHFDTSPSAWWKKEVAKRRAAQFKRAVAWLLDSMNSKPLFRQQMQNSATETATVALLVHKGTLVIPPDLAKRLVESGLRVGYNQLVEAARAGVPGIEVWSRAQQQCGVETDVPEYAKYAALGSWEWLEVRVS